MKIMAHDMPDSHWPKKAKKNGICFGTYHRRVTVYGWSKEGAATKPLKQPASRKPDPNSTAQKLKRHGLSTRTCWRYRKKNPDTTLTDDEIIAAALERRKVPTLAAQARARGLQRATASQRISRGRSLDEALNMPVKSPQEARKMRKAKGWSE